MSFQSVSSLPHAPIPPTFSANVNSLSRLGKTIAKLEKMEMDGGRAYAIQKATEDTATSLGSRMLVVSGVAEAVEVLFNELLETGVVYGVIGPVAQRFNHLFQGLAKKGLDASQQKVLDGLEGQSIQKMNAAPAIKARLAPARLATFLSAIAVSCLFGQSAIIYAKNILTAYSFNKDSFSGLLHLKGENTMDPSSSPTVQKSKKRIGQLTLATLGVVGGSSILARFGHQLTGGVQKAIHSLAGAFDFDRAKKGGKLMMGMTRNHLMGFMAIAFAAYLDAARDKLERQETAPRLLIIFANLLFFKGAFDKHVVLPVAKKFAPELVKGNELLKYPELKKQGVLKTLTPKRLRAVRRFKNGLFLAPYVFGTVIVSATNSVLNRYFTKKRFQKDYVAPVIEHMSVLDRKPLKPLGAFSFKNTKNLKPSTQVAFSA